MSYYIKYELGFMSNSKMLRIYIWAVDNVEIKATNIEKLYEDHTLWWEVFRFDNEEDAVAFKLRWA